MKQRLLLAAGSLVITVLFIIVSDVLLGTMIGEFDDLVYSHSTVAGPIVLAERHCEQTAVARRLADSALSCVSARLLSMDVMSSAYGEPEAGKPPTWLHRGNDPGLRRA